MKSQYPLSEDIVSTHSGLASAKSGSLVPPYDMKYISRGLEMADVYRNIQFEMV